MANRDRTQADTRQLSWQGCYNVRDLGGLPTTSGGVTKYGSIVRSDLLSRLTPAGWQAVADYGVQTIIDLRGVAEVAQSPYHLGQMALPDYYNMPLEGDDAVAADQMAAAQTRSEVYRLILRYYPDLIANVMRRIASAPAGGLILHCHAGKDRTGILSALLLRLVGVSDEHIGADYAASQQRLWPLYEQLVAEAGDEAQINPWLKPVATAAMILQPLHALEREHSSVAAYLRKAELAESEIDQLKARLLFGG